MTSRKLGKLLVYTNLVLSVFFLAWSLGLYSQRLDWAPHKNLISGQVTAETGQLYFLQDEIKRLLEQRDLAEIRWQKDAADLPNQENLRFTARDWYREQMQLANLGVDRNGQAVPDPVRKLVPDPASSLGLFIMNKPDKCPPVQNRGLSLKSVAQYEKDLKEAQRKIQEAQEQVDKQFAEAKRLNELIVGKNEPPDPPMDGLRQQLDGVLKSKKLWLDEMAELHPLLANQLINVEIHKRRVADLEGRMKELQAVVGRAN